MAFRFLHAADLHLDTPFVGIGRVAEEIAAELRDASLRAWDALVDTAIARRVDFIVLAGDIYDGAERGLRAQIRFHNGLRRLDQERIRVFIAHGNHDPVDEGWSAIQAWPSTTTVFDSGRVNEVPFAASDGTPVVVHGISFSTRAEPANLASRFPIVSAGAFAVAVLHANVGGDPAHDPYSPCTLDDLTASGHHYWALGHIHTRQILHRAPHVVYPGNLQGRGFGAGERGAKGAMLVTVQDRAVETEFVALDQARFVDFDIDVTDCADIAAAHAAVVEAGETESSEADGRRLLARATLTGTSDFGAELQHPDFIASLRDASPDVWWAEVRVRVRRPLDLDALRGGQDLRAAVVAERDTLVDHDALDELVKAAVPDATLRTLLDALDPAEIRDLLDDATRDALHRLNP